MGNSRRRRSGMREAMNRNGLTLVEMMISLLIFAIAIGISTKAFQQLVKRGSLQGKTAESNIEGIMGLEMMRTDISHAGYGLPWAFQITPTYNPNEVTTSLLATSEVDSQSFNDSLTASKVPRAIMSKPGASGIDYLVIKGTVLGMTDTAKRWNFVSYSSAALTNYSYLKPRAVVAANEQYADTNLKQNDLVATVVSTYSPSGAETRTLMAPSASSYYSTVSGNPVTSSVLATTGFQPVNATDTVVAYGIKPSSGGISMPYNRIDFYVDKNATKPVSCAPGTGVLYKAVADHAGGFVKYPLLDCVGDMQVVYYDANYTPYDDTSIAGMADDVIRSTFTEVRVFILTHEGKKDTGFSYPDPTSPYMNGDANNVICVAPLIATTGGCTDTVGRMWNKTASGSKSMPAMFGTGWRNYRWKVLTFTVSLKNLQ